MAGIERELLGRQTLHEELIERIERELYLCVEAVKERQADRGTVTLTLTSKQDEAEGVIVEVTLKDVSTVKTRYLPENGQMVLLP